MIIKYLYVIIIFFFSSFCVEAQQTVYHSIDSMKVVEVLNNVKALPLTENKTVFIGKQFLGTPYVASTLEKGRDERLIVNLHELDCTTFVETVTALTIASKQNNPDFNDFIDALQLLRYRDGILDGYPSRLHYFSEWIQNNADKGLIEDITAEAGTSSLVLNPFFMSSHADKYSHLLNNSRNIEKIKEAERNLKGKEIHYFAKADLNNPQIIRNINSGDIIAIITNIKGLDITHVGIAVYKNGELHLLHASSKYMKVVVEGVDLYSQLKNNKTHIGVRVMRIK